MKRLSGFTLIELLIVIIIIGILATLALPQFNKVMERAREPEAYINIRAVIDSMYRYYIEKGKMYHSHSYNVADMRDFSELDIGDPTSATWTYFLSPVLYTNDPRRPGQPYSSAYCLDPAHSVWVHATGSDASHAVSGHLFADGGVTLWRRDGSVTEAEIYGDPNYMFKQVNP